MHHTEWERELDMRFMKKAWGSLTEQEGANQASPPAGKDHRLSDARCSLMAHAMELADRIKTDPGNPELVRKAATALCRLADIISELKHLEETL